MPDEFLTPATIHWYASRVADGTGTREEARELLADFVHRRNKGVDAPSRLLEHLADCLRDFLNSERTLLQAPEVGRPQQMKVPIATLEKAFGLEGVFRGRKLLTEEEAAPIAHAVLRRRFDGATFEEARDAVAESHHKSPRAWLHQHKPGRSRSFGAARSNDAPASVELQSTPR